VIKAVLFDFGGVLSEAGKRGSVRGWLGRVYGLDVDVQKMQDVFRKMWRGQMSDDEFMDEIRRRFPDTPIVDKGDFMQHMQHFNRSEPVYALAERLRQHGLKTGVLSNVFSIGVQALRAGGFYNGFDPVLLSCEVGYAKPDPEFYQMAIDRLGVQPEEIIFIDDQQYCIDPAQEMGMHVILARSPEQIVHDAEAIVFQENGVKL